MSRQFNRQKYSIQEEVMSKKGENIYKRKDGRWEGRYIKFYDENFKPKYGYIYGHTYTEVKNKLLVNKADTVSETTEVKTLLYSQILEQWLNSVKINVKESTYVRYCGLVNNHIIQYLGKYPVSKISTMQIETYIRMQLQSGQVKNAQPLSSKTVNDILTVIKSSMEYAKYNGYTVICNLSKVTIKNTDKEMRILNQDEQTKLTQFLVSEMDLSKFGILLSLYTGIRIGELCALQWSDFDMENKVIKINKTLQRIQNIDGVKGCKTKIVITEPKSQCSVREIPIPNAIMNYVEMFHRSQKEYILTGEKKNFVEPRTMQNRFKNYLEKSGIESVNFHALRHTFATRCIELGFEIKSLSEILGHASVNITLNRYVHSSFELKSSNMNKLSVLV